MLHGLCPSFLPPDPSPGWYQIPRTTLHLTSSTFLSPWSDTCIAFFHTEQFHLGLPYDKSRQFSLAQTALQINKSADILKSRIVFFLCLFGFFLFANCWRDRDIIDQNNTFDWNAYQQSILFSLRYFHFRLYYWSLFQKTNTKLG